jgi:hypothetical protein
MTKRRANKKFSERIFYRNPMHWDSMPFIVVGSVIALSVVCFVVFR